MHTSLGNMPQIDLAVVEVGLERRRRFWRQGDAAWEE